MKCWQVGRLRFVSAVGGTEKTFAAVLFEARRLGFRYCAFGMKGPVPLIAPRVLWCSNYPLAFKQRYEERDYLQRDPTVVRAITSDQSFLWSDELFADNLDIRAEARAFGLVHGWAHPHRDAGGMLSLLSLVRSDPEITADEVRSKTERLLWLSHRSHVAMREHWGPTLRAPLDVELSDRERDVLRWTSDGKTSAEVARILVVSEATVNFHIRNACMKLGTGSRTAATVRAAMMGLLW